jgi:hypothetical protein
MKLCGNCDSTEADHDTKFIEVDGVLMCEACITEVLRVKGEEYRIRADEFYGREYGKDTLTRR